MDNKQIDYAIEEMNKWVQRNEPEQSHLRTMIPVMQGMADKCEDPDTKEKLMRWIGFMQGALWQRGEFTVDDFRAMNTKEID